MSSIVKTHQEKAPMRGIYIGDTGAAVMEIAAISGFDYIRLDAEHTYASPQELRELIRIADAYQVPVLVRTPSFEDMTRLLDFGATGILLPDVRTAAEVAKAVAMCKYGPVGGRGVCRVARCMRYGAISGPDYHAQAAAETCVAVQIESEEGMANLDEILSVPGVDMVTAGPEDMAQSMGLWGQTKHPAILAAQDRMLELAHQHGKLVMLSAGTRERYQELKRKQADLITIAFDTDVIMSAFHARMEAIAGD